MKYSITTLCIGNKYTPILQHWLNRTTQKCKNAVITVFNDSNYINNIHVKNRSGLIWLLRFKQNIDYFKQNMIPLVMCDLDIIIEKDIEPLIQLPFDIIISKEIGGTNAYPTDCSNILGFGVCAGFVIFKVTALSFMTTILDNMINGKYNTCDDQVNIMKYIVNNKHSISNEIVKIYDKCYNNIIIDIDNIKICVLDFDIIVRDPIMNIGQVANHINIDNVGGSNNFIKYFYEDLEKLPLTCRCGKTHLGDNNKCIHIDLRNINKCVC